MSLPLIVLLSLYLVGSVIFTSYILFCHSRASFNYFRRLFTAKELNTGNIKTYFGWKYHETHFCEDHWAEVLVISTLKTLFLGMITFVAWPVLSLVFLNSAIYEARARIERDS